MNTALLICPMTNEKYNQEIRVNLGLLWDELQSEDKSLTNDEAAEETGIHKNTISKYRNGASIVQITNLWKLARLLEDRLGRRVSIEDMLEIVSTKRVSKD